MPTATTPAAVTATVKDPGGALVLTATTIGGQPATPHSTPALNTPVTLPLTIPGNTPVTVYLPPGAWTATITDTTGRPAATATGTSTTPTALTVAPNDVDPGPTAYTDAALGAAIALGG